MAISAGGNPNRQRMINLMYIIFIAMMALNISPEVLDGFSYVEHELRQTTRSLQEQNQRHAALLASSYQANPAKAAHWYARSQALGKLTDSLTAHLQELKALIASHADHRPPSDQPEALEHKDDLSAASEVLLDPSTQRGKELRGRLAHYREQVAALFETSEEALPQLKRLQTSSPSTSTPWEERLFERQPAIAAITLLTQLQNALRYTEGELLGEMLRRIDLHDYRSNILTAQLIPQSRVVLQGEPYEAQIVLSSIDSTKHPRVFLDGQPSPIKDGKLTLPTSQVGTYTLRGHIETELSDGTPLLLPFSSEYTVQAPTASIAPAMLNILYAGIDNPLRIAVPGLPSTQLSVTTSAGTLSRQGELWSIHPRQADSDLTITVRSTSAQGEGRLIAQQRFHVRSLPDPLPFLSLTTKEGSTRFKGGKISRQALLTAGEVQAALDDSFLDIRYTVLRFQLLAIDALGNALPESSRGRFFSDRQLHLIRSTPLGRRLFITEIIAQGPDGIERRLPSLELLLH